MVNEEGTPSVTRRLATMPLKLAWAGFVIAVPTLGVWLASSLAAYFNGPIWLVCAAGVLAFPVGPLLWELWGARRRSKKAARLQEQNKKLRPRILTLSDRLLLRTLALNLVFVTALVVAAPEVGFTALSARGDWMLDDVEGEAAEGARELLFSAANGLEFIHNLARANRYADEVDDSDADQIVVDRDDIGNTEQRQPDRDDDDTATADDEPTDGVAWPMTQKLHPAVAAMTDEQETSIEAVAKQIGAAEDNPFLRVKALHDWIADRVVYDIEALDEGRYPPQDAETVFRTRRAVCAGYSRLFKAMAAHTGDEAVYVVGVSRDLEGSVGGAGHAWNAVKVEGKWYLVDVTWDAGHITDDRTFKKSYRTVYLFVPPEVIGYDHFPDDDKWQLRSPPIDRGTFIRQPILQPSFYAEGWELVSPRRAQVDTEDNQFQIVLKNHRRRHLLVSTSSGARCDVSTDASNTTTAVCPTKSDGRYQINMFSNDEPYGSHAFVGKLEVNRR